LAFLSRLRRRPAIAGGSSFQLNKSNLASSLSFHVLIDGPKLNLDEATGQRMTFRMSLSFLKGNGCSCSRPSFRLGKISLFLPG